MTSDPPPLSTKHSCIGESGERRRARNNHHHHRLFLTSSLPVGKECVAVIFGERSFGAEAQQHQGLQSSQTRSETTTIALRNHNSSKLYVFWPLFPVTFFFVPVTTINHNLHLLHSFCILFSITSLLLFPVRNLHHHRLPVSRDLPPFPAILNLNTPPPSFLSTVTIDLLHSSRALSAISVFF